MLLEPLVASLPEFPHFKKLELTDREALEQVALRFQPFSDYNFTSLYSYDTLERVELSSLHGNVVVQFIDYVTTEPFLSFLGDNRLLDTVGALLEHARARGLVEELRLVPDLPGLAEQAARRYLVEEDPDNFDYILSALELAEMKGSKYRAKRNLVHRFLHSYPHHQVVDLDLADPAVQQEVEDLLCLWEKMKNIPKEETENEVTAIRRLLRSVGRFPDLVPIGIYVEGRLVGFSIDERVHAGHGLIHFEKADLSYVGCYQYLKMATARRFLELGCSLINYEQDLGLPNLRKAKRQWQPVSYLKKLRLRRRP